MRAALESKLAARLALLFLAVSLLPILGAGWLFARTFEDTARLERERRQRLLAERCAALAEDHVERAHAKLRTVARLFAEDPGFEAWRGESGRNGLVQRLQERVEPPDVFLELQFYVGGKKPEIVSQVRQRGFEEQQQPGAAARNAQQLHSNFEAPLVQLPLNDERAYRDDKLSTIEGFQTLLISVPVARPEATGALVAYVDFAPLREQLAALAGDEYALDLSDAKGTRLASVGAVQEPAPPLDWGSPDGAWRVRVEESERPFARSAAQLRRQTWIWCGIAALLAFASSLALSAWITRPIERLQRAAEELASGNFAASAALERKDEIGRLSVAFDRMAGSLLELDRAKSEFVANVSHELRTPLTSLKLSVANLLDGVVGEVPAGQRATLQRVQGELERLIRLVNQLLEMARLEAGAIEPRYERIELEPLAREVAASLQPIAGEHAVTLRVEGAGAVRADRSMLERVLLNLLDNAIKFSPPRGTVVIALSPGGFRVQDQGPGIETSFTFEPFRQGKQHGVKNPGVGLGLAIVRKLVELNGGSVRLESGEGAGLVVELPRA